MAAGDQKDEDEEYKELAEGFKNEGNDLFKQGKYKDAIDAYSKGIDIDPDNHVLFSNRSAAYLKEQERGKALKDAERCMELNPQWAKSYVRKGAAQHSLFRYQAAMDTYKEGLKFFPNDKSLEEGLKAVEEAFEVDRKARYEHAKKEREAEEAKRKEADRKLQEAKAKAGMKAAEEEVVGDDLDGFFSEISKVTDGPKAKDEEKKKTLSMMYAEMDLGTSESQIARLLQTNFAWKNLNPYEVLQLDIDATEEDIKLRYRKLSTLVHPDKCLNIPTAREAFEEVKKAYNTLMDEDRRLTTCMIIENTRKYALKERKQKLKKGMTEREVGTEDECMKKAVMKEFADIEQRKRMTEAHELSLKKRERDQEEEEKQKMRNEMEFEKEWTEENRREGRVSNWRDFQKDGSGTKKHRLSALKTEENVTDKPKFGGVQKDEWKKNWK